MVGISGYGIYIPRYRIKLTDIAEIWQKVPSEIINGLRITEKAVPAIDEDAVTLAVAAGQKALAMSELSAEKIGSVFVGSESHPYTVNPSSSIVAEYLGVGNDYFAADLEFACKAATAGLQATFGFLKSDEIDYGLVIGSDTAQGKPHDALEYTAGSYAAAYILSKKKRDILASLIATTSYTSDTPDFWRREGSRYPSHFGRFSGEPAYFTHVVSAGKKLFAKTGMQPSDFAYCVFHMPNGKFPRVAAKKLGFTPEQLAPSLVVEHIGNGYSATAMTGLAAVLDIAKPKQKIFVVSYGSGAGSDAFIFETTVHLPKKRKNTIPVMKQLEQKVYLSYAQYLKHTHTI